MSLFDKRDTGLTEPNDPELEACFRIGWLVAISAITRLATATESVIRFERGLQKLVRRGRHLRTKRHTTAAEISLGGKQCLQRFLRGQMEAVEIAAAGVAAKNLVFATMDELRSLLSNWSDSVFRWSVSVEPDDTSTRIHPPLFPGLTGEAVPA